MRTFEECQLRGAWVAARVPPLLPSSPAARLGTVVHHLLEEAGRGKFTAGGRTSLDDRWQALVADAELGMSRNALEARFVPLRDSVPKYEVVRHRAEARAIELSLDLPRAQPRLAEAGADPYGYELWVESNDGLIAGRIDRVVPTPGGPVLQDYKSGAIFSIREGEAPEIKPEYTDQLRLYAALYFEATGTWPSKLELVPLSGPPRDVSHSAIESLKLLEHARELLACVNIELQRDADDWIAVEATLARPSATACRFCSYRPACAGYLARQVRDEPEWPADVVGRFRALTPLGNGGLMLTITLADGSVAFVRGVTNRTAGASTLETLREGDPIGVFNARRTKVARAFEEGPLTIVYTVQ